MLWQSAVLGSPTAPEHSLGVFTDLCLGLESFSSQVTSQPHLDTFLSLLWVTLPGQGLDWMNSSGPFPSQLCWASVITSSDK